MKKTIGILGGMGPLATTDLMEKIIRHTDAGCDQEHIHICVDCNTNIPDRTAAILRHGEDPLPEMVKSAVRLQAMGADVLIMPCNTAHFFLEHIQKFVDIPILNMPQETAKYLQSRGIFEAAVLATDGTIQCGIYDKALREAGIHPIYPDTQEQQMIMSLIYDCVKAGKPCSSPEKVHGMRNRLLEEGAKTLILGCTELPIAFSQLGISEQVVDPTDVLAQAAINFVQGKIKLTSEN